MKERTISSAIIFAIATVVAVFSEYLVYPIVLSILAVVAVFEILRVMKSQKKYVLSIPAYMLAAVFPIISYFITPTTVMPFLLMLAASMFVYLMWLMGVSVFSRGKIPFSRVSEVFASSLYVTVSFTSLSIMRYIDRKCGIFGIILVFLVAWGSDVFAFLSGKLFGKHKLIPEVSPKKTVEGSIGGIVSSIVLCLLFGFIVELIVNGITVNYIVLGLCGAILSVVSQLGDLIASLIKREWCVKDYGKIFPGHGGIMDRFDSVLAVSTILLIIFIVCPPFVFT